MEVTADGEGVVSHAGLALLRGLADKTGLTTGLSRALASTRLLVHDRSRVAADLACAIADGARAISDFRVMGDQRGLFGPVASVPTAWRTLEEIAAGGTRTGKKINAAVNTGASHDLIQHLHKLARRPGYQLIYSVGWAMTERAKTAIRLVPEQAWVQAIGPIGALRERRAADACDNSRCGHARCWVEDAHVAELTGLLRHGPGGDQLANWPEAMRVFVRRERPHPGAQLTLFETQDGWRYTLWVTNRPMTARGWLREPQYIDAAHRVHARVEDCIRTGKDTGLGRFPSHDFAINTAWLTAAMTAAVLLAWLKLLALDGHLAKAEPKTLRYRAGVVAAVVDGGGAVVPGRQPTSLVIAIGDLRLWDLHDRDNGIWIVRQDTAYVGEAARCSGAFILDVIPATIESMATLPLIFQDEIFRLYSITIHLFARNRGQLYLTN